MIIIMIMMGRFGLPVSRETEFRETGLPVLDASRRCVLGEQKTAAITAEIRGALADVREKVVETSALVAWRPAST